jgi:hypothetical protein
VYRFSHRGHAEVLDSTEMSAHASPHLMAQLLSLQEPCVVKMALKRRYQYEFD